MRGVSPRWAVSSLLGLMAVFALGVVTAVPAQAATNPTLGDLSASTPSANPYAGCVAAILAGSGVTFGSAASLGTELAAVWPTLPAGVVTTCKKAVDTHQPQVCVNPANPATCPAVGAADAATLVNQALSVTGTWRLATDGQGIGGYALTPIPTGLANATPIAVVTGTFTTPSHYCSTSDCATLPGLWNSCGLTTCGQVTAMTVSVIGRTPAENAVLAHFRIVDGFGNLSEATDVFGNGNNGSGCGPGDCTFNVRLPWNCKDAAGQPSNCGGQTLTVIFTFETDLVSPPPTVGQLVEIQLSAPNLSWQANAICPNENDCMRYDDARLSYLDARSAPTAVQGLGATVPSAVIDLASSNLGCLVAADVTKGPAISCVDVSGGIAPLVQTAHAPVAPAPPPTIAAAAAPATATVKWEAADVTVTLTANDGNGPGVQSITYSATGAQQIPQTTVPAASVLVNVTTDGTTTINAYATDMTGTSGAAQSLTVKLDKTPPAVACAAAPTAWSSSDVHIACSANDAISGLANPAQAQFSLATFVADGTETASASTNSFSVCDGAGNCTLAGPIGGIKVDTKAPSITCAASPASWSSTDVSIACSASDGGSGLADPTQAQFSLTTSVPAGANTVSASTNSVTVCDLVGNCATAGPITGLQVDRLAPTVSCAPAPTTVSAGNVSVACSAGDGGSGLADPTQAYISLTTSVPVGTETTSAATNSVRVCDAAGNCATAGPVGGISIDRKAPSITCAPAPTTWSATDVSFACSASDGLSGLANPAQATLTLSTSVAAGTETASASTNSVSVCDIAGNCATAGPIGGLKVDRRAPSIIITAPAGSYSAGQVIKAAYTCTDAGSGAGSCTGTVPAGTAIDTAAVGPQTFTVNATDGVGNPSQLIVAYTVTAAVAPPPVCNPGERNDHEGNHENDCEKHGVAVRPVKEPEPKATPTPRPEPKPTHKPTHNPAKSGDDNKDGSSNKSGD